MPPPGLQDTEFCQNSESVRLSLVFEDEDENGDKILETFDDLDGELEEKFARIVFQAVGIDKVVGVWNEKLRKKSLEDPKKSEITKGKDKFF